MTFLRNMFYTNLKSGGFMNNIVIRGLSFLQRKLEFYLYRLSIPSKVRILRAKQKIKVLFVVSEVSIWKTEDLYVEMLNHPRFEPVLGVALLTADKPSEAFRKFGLLTKYLSDKNYSYVELFGNDISGNVKPDIIFYQQPYGGVIDTNLFFCNNKEALFCHVNYGFNSIGQKWVGASLYLHYCWQTYYENSTSMNYYESVLPALSRKNAHITGLPFQNILEKDKAEFVDPWKPQNKIKKRIIWAPHHTIPTANNLIEYSTFLDVADIMLSIAQEYKECIQIAFKPHPFLMKKLYNVWGKDRTDSYYQKWTQMENTQLETGEYYGLFKHSDAMIHDSSSFTIEYLYMGNPVMYLSNGKPHTETLNDFGKAAYDTHVIGETREDIVLFIKDIIYGNDRLKIQREQFLKKYLMIPKTGNASLNIIDSILG